MKTKQSSSSIDSGLLTVAANDVDQTICSTVAMPSQRSGLVLSRPTRWNASSCIIETDGRGCGHNFARLRIEHLDYLEYCSFFTRFASVSSYDAACSCSASFQRFTRLLDLRSVMRFFFLTSCRSAFAPAGSAPSRCGCSLTSCRSALHACCWLCSFLAAYVRHPSLVDLLVVHLEPQILLHSMQQEVTLEVHRILLPHLVDGHNRHSSPSPSCHVSRAVRDPLITSDAKPPESDMWTS